jgi:four helix bundle protein
MATAHGFCIRHRPVPITSYRDLEAWQVGMDFAVLVYALTKQFPREERYGLSSQLRRAAIAIPSNVGEGHRHGTKAYIHFVTIALGSLAEAETQIELARRLRFAPEAQFERLNEMAASLARLLHGLRRSLEHHLAQSQIPNP